MREPLFRAKINQSINVPTSDETVVEDGENDEQKVRDGQDTDQSINQSITFMLLIHTTTKF